jgi:hypothetical protein
LKKRQEHRAQTNEARGLKSKWNELARIKKDYGLVDWTGKGCSDGTDGVDSAG